ncbi:hypothetical protein Ancab_010382 [Ancistrocladus abbreviatus]
MDVAAQLKRGISRQFSTGSMRKSGRFSFKRQSSLDPQRNNLRFSFGRQSSLDPIRRSTVSDEPLTVPENLDATMQLLFMASRGDVKGVQDLLDDGTDVNSIDLDGRTALHIAACEGHVEVVKLLLSRKANIDARDRWGSTRCSMSRSKFDIKSIPSFLSLWASLLRNIGGTRKQPSIMPLPNTGKGLRVESKRVDSSHTNFHLVRLSRCEPEVDSNIIYYRKIQISAVH